MPRGESRVWKVVQFTEKVEDKRKVAIYSG